MKPNWTGAVTVQASKCRDLNQHPAGKHREDKFEFGNVEFGCQWGHTLELANGY